LRKDLIKTSGEQIITKYQLSDDLDAKKSLLKKEINTINEAFNKTEMEESTKIKETLTLLE